MTEPTDLTTSNLDSNNSPGDTTSSSVSYKDAGVDIEAGNALVERIKGVAAATQRPEVLGGLGGFGALCEIPNKYREPVLVSGTDGVGTKLRLAMDLGIHDSIGIDLVAMCVNDLIVGGAEPLFFLDYYATGKLNVDIAADVIKGISDGCRQAGCALVGGETAEMPGMYSGEDYDLAGFCVGVVEKSKIIDGRHVGVGNKLIALASSGPHSNGYSLIRKLIELKQADLQQSLQQPLDKTQDSNGQPRSDTTTTLAQALIAPTRIYVKSILSLLERVNINALCHITGGGFIENIPRVLPENVVADINLSSWSLPPVFEWLQAQGNITKEELYRTFNCGVGMLLCVADEQTEAVLQHLQDLGEDAWIIGSISAREDQQPQVNLLSP